MKSRNKFFIDFDKPILCSAVIVGLYVKLSRKFKNGTDVAFDIKGGSFMAIMLAVTNCLAGAGVSGGCYSN